jgi:hypothetical protein
MCFADLAKSQTSSDDTCEPCCRAGRKAPLFERKAALRAVIVGAGARMLASGLCGTGTPVAHQ